MDKKYTGYLDSPIGCLEIITSDYCVVSISFAKEDQKPFEPVPILKETIFQLEEYFRGERREFSLRLYLNGTDFQRKVWNELLNIPYGETTTYGQLASRIGNNKAVRAVGGANNKNNLPIIIPCHRVVGSNGSLVGFAGGLDKKRWLLEHERNNL